MKAADEVELIGAFNASCLAATARLPGSLVIWDDGSIPDLTALAT